MRWDEVLDNTGEAFDQTGQVATQPSPPQPPSPIPAEDALYGTLDEFPLPALLHSLATRNRTGVLTISTGSNIWFAQGRIYLASSSIGSSIGAVLYGADAGSLEEIQSMFASPDAAGSVIDQLLTKRPRIEPSLRRLLHEYNLNALFEMLVPSDAEFSFEGERRHKLGDRFAQDTRLLVTQAEQRLDIWRRIASRIPSTAAVFKMAPTLPESTFERLVTGEEWQFLARVNGTNTVADIITDTGESAFRVCSTLYRMLLEDLIVEAPAPFTAEAELEAAAAG